MKILITGAKGQLGLTLQNVLSDHELILTDHEELDITNGPAVMTFVEQNKPEAIINAAAYTAVDKAEEEVEIAKKINVFGAKNLAQAAKEFGTLFFHISTDFVFDGKKTTPYIETDEPKPLSIYGQTKYDGELAVQEIAGRYFLLRTAWLYSPYGKNFVKTIAKLGKEKEELKIVNDQIGCPTYTYDLATAVKFLMDLDSSNKAIQQYNNEKIPYGIFHYAGAGQCSWFEFATEIVRRSGGTARVLPQTSEEYAASRDTVTASRPKYSVLDCSKIQKLGIKTIPWRESLKECIETLREKEEL